MASNGTSGCDEAVCMSTMIAMMVSVLVTVLVTMLCQ